MEIIISIILIVDYQMYIQVLHQHIVLHTLQVVAEVALAEASLEVAEAGGGGGGCGGR